jgi:hypothetical protein
MLHSNFILVDVATRRYNPKRFRSAVDVPEKEVPDIRSVENKRFVETRCHFFLKNRYGVGATPKNF